MAFEDAVVVSDLAGVDLVPIAFVDALKLVDFVVLEDF